MEKTEYSGLEDRVEVLNKALRRLSKAIGRLNKHLGTGLEQLRIANEMWAAEIEIAKLSVTEEKVKDFAERNMLSHGYARELLESAAINAAAHGEKPYDGSFSEEYAPSIGDTA